MSISEQIKELRKLANSKEFEPHEPVTYGFYARIKSKLFKAADTIEALSAKLETANKELERWHTDKINDKIKNPFAQTSTLICHNCDHKDEYIEELEAADMERSAEDCGGGWIYCGDGKNLPEDGVDVLVWYEYFRYGEYNRLFQTTGISFVHNGKWSGFVNGQSGWNQLRIIAWQPLPEPYHEP